MKFPMVNGDLFARLFLVSPESIRSNGYVFLMAIYEVRGILLAIAEVHGGLLEITEVGQHC